MAQTAQDVVTEIVNPSADAKMQLQSLSTTSGVMRLISEQSDVVDQEFELKAGGIELQLADACKAQARELKAQGNRAAAREQQGKAETAFRRAIESLRKVRSDCAIALWRAQVQCLRCPSHLPTHLVRCPKH